MIIQDITLNKKQIYVTIEGITNPFICHLPSFPDKPTLIKALKNALNTVDKEEMECEDKYNTWVKDMIGDEIATD